MAFCTHSQEKSDVSFTVIDNVFITQFMPLSDHRCVEVYLYGLFLCGAHQNENTMDTMCRELDMTQEDILTAFSYWEELGLVHIHKSDEIKVVYLPARSDRSILKKIKSSKYHEFCAQMQTVISGRMISTNEFNEYFYFLETTLFQPEALVSVAAYCVEMKGNNINYPYILKIARDFNTQHILTVEAIKEKLSQRSRYGEDLKLVLSALKLKRAAEYYDKEMYERWVKDYNFTLDVILKVARGVKTGGVNKLNSLLEEYYKRNLLSVKEIEEYQKTKEQLFETAKEINAQLGVYYQSLEAEISEYILPWITKGYDKQTLLIIALYCFKNNVRTLEGMARTVERFYKLGLVDGAAINQYIGQVLQRDKEIKKLLEALGLLRNVNVSDRAAYKLWREEWDTAEDVIFYGASLSAGASNPMAYLNKLLSNWRQKGVKNIEQAKKQSVQAPYASTQRENVFLNYPQRDYSEEDLRALFDDIEDVEV